MPRRESCKLCHYFEHLIAHAAGEGECVEDSPRHMDGAVDSNSADRQRGLWPLVHESRFCGKYLEANPETPE